MSANAPIPLPLLFFKKNSSINGAFLDEIFIFQNPNVVPLSNCAIPFISAQDKITAVEAAIEYFGFVE